MRERVLRRAGAVVVAFVMTWLATGTCDAAPAAGEPTVPPAAVGEWSGSRATALDSRQAIGGSSSCPRPQQVWKELGTLVAPDELASRLVPRPSAGATPVEIVDLGARYRIILATAVREYRDEGRDCNRRARFAALFIALALAPPATVPPAAVAGAPAPAAPPVPPETPRAAVVPPPPKVPSPPPVTETSPATTPAIAPARFSLGSALEVGAAVHVGSGTDNRLTEGGVGLRLVLGRGTWAVVGGTRISLPVDTAVGGVSVSLWRLPFGLGLRALSASTGRLLRPHAEAGLQATIVSGRAVDLLINERTTAVEFGLRAAAGMRLVRASWERLAPFLELAVEYLPRSTGVHALPRGLVGHTPSLWLGATAGASIDL